MSTKAKDTTRWLRLGCYLLLLFGGSSWWLARQAHAELSERALQVGRELSRIHPSKAGITPMRINGQRLSLSSLVVPHSVEEVLNRFAAHCGRASGGLQAELESLPRGVRLPAEVQAAQFGVFRSDGEREGTAACFARAGEGGLKRLAQAMEQVVETGDFAALGELRYVFARRAQNGKDTHVISVWSQGPLRIAEMFPEQGDVPGEDVVAGVRPPAAQRVLATETLDAAYKLTLYHSQARPEAVLSSYDQQLGRLGFAPAARDAIPNQLPLAARLYTRDGGEALVVLALDDGAGKTLVSALRPGIDAHVTLEQ